MMIIIVYLFILKIINKIVINKIIIFSLLLKVQDVLIPPNLIFFFLFKIFKNSKILKIEFSLVDLSAKIKISQSFFKIQ